MENEELYNSIKECAVNIFGEDNLWIDLLFPNNPALVIRAGDIEMENEDKETHLNRGIYVKVSLKNGNFNIAKTTYTPNEYLNNYTHSHVSTSTVKGSYGTPCLGSGPIGRTISSLVSDNTDMTTWVTYFLQLKEYLETESLTGGPYIKFRNLVEGRYTPLYTNLLINNFKISRLYYTLLYDTAMAVLTNNEAQFRFSNLSNDRVYIEVSRNNPNLKRLYLASLKELHKQYNEIIKDLGELQIQALTQELYDNTIPIRVKSDNIQILQKYQSTTINPTSNSTRVVFNNEKIKLKIVIPKEGMKDSIYYGINNESFSVIVDVIRYKLIENRLKVKNNQIYL